MNLDRFTEKAQEAIVAAQELAARLNSPVLDAEHLLSALVEPGDGVPAETLRRLGVDLPGFRGEIAAILAKRARIQGGSLTLDPRAKRVIDRADVPEGLKEKGGVALDLGSTIAGAKFGGEFEEGLRAVLKEIKDSDGAVILFTDELHPVVGAGAAEGARDASNLLKPMLAR